MLRRGFSRGQSSGDSLPTHGGSSSSIEGFSSSSSGYGGFSVFGGYNNGGKYNKHKRVGYFPLTYVSIGMVVLNVILTGLWMNSKGHYRSLLLALNAKDVSTAIFKVQWTEKEVARVRNEMATDERLAETRYGPRIRQLERENKKWKTERDQLKEKYESPRKKQVDSRLKKREPAYLEQIELMQRAIRKESRRTVLERYVGRSLFAVMAS